MQPVNQSQSEGSVTDGGLTSAGGYLVGCTLAGVDRTRPVALSVWQVELRRLPACPAAGVCEGCLRAHQPNTPDPTAPLLAAQLLSSARGTVSTALCTAARSSALYTAVLYYTQAGRPRPCNNTCIWHHLMQLFPAFT